MGKKQKLVAKNISIKPSDYARSAFKANGFAIDSIKDEAESLFVKPTQEMIEAYKPQVLDAVRRNEIDKVKELHQSGVLKNNCCNKFGESILHLACRRGYTEIARYLLEEVKVDVNIRDDYNRNPIHDACWTPSPEFELVDMLVRKAPHQLLMEDVRGFTPFDYVRKEHCGKWLRFLWERKATLRPLEESKDEDSKEDSKDDEMTTASVLASLRS